MVEGVILLIVMCITMILAVAGILLEGGDNDE